MVCWRIFNRGSIFATTSDEYHFLACDTSGHGQRYIISNLRETGRRTSSVHIVEGPSGLSTNW